MTRLAIRATNVHRRVDLAALVGAVALLALAQIACGPIDSGGSGGGSSSPPVAAFTQDVSAGQPGLTVQFSDRSTGDVTAWSWDFGNGQTSSLQSPLATFAANGSYSVRLRVTGPGGASSATKADLISVGDAVTAAFSCTPAGLVGEAPFSVDCTDASQNASSWAWDFGGQGTSTEQSPGFTFATPGSYTIELTASGAGGTAVAQQAVEVTAPAPPMASFRCVPTATPTFVPPEPEGYVPLGITCTDQSQGASSWAWSFGDQGTSSTQNPEHTYTESGAFTIGLTVTGPGGQATATATALVHPLGIHFDPASGSAPLDVQLSPDDPAGRLGAWTWIVDGENLGSTPVLDHRFLEPGTHTVQLVGVRLSPPMVGSVVEQFLVDFGVPVAAIDDTLIGGTGPLAARLLDRSGGEIDSWTWSFGDGAGCVYPASALPDPAPSGVGVCDASSPSHTYGATGSYDVSLTVTGPSVENGPSDASSSTTASDLVRVYIVDPSFEEQTANGAIGGAWTSLRPSDATEPAVHEVLSSASGGADLAMPSRGSKWAVLDGLGTDGATGVQVVENGIRQDFLHPPGQPVVEFDYALLYAEPTVALVRDAVVATVSDGVVEVPIPSSAADTATPYAGPPVRYPALRDDGIVRSTPRLTASLDLEEAFPASNELTRFTLTVRTTNAVNGRRSPRAYVDGVRFTESLDALPVNFEIETEPALAGEPVDFTDTSCPAGTGGCLPPTSWRWDFGTQASTSPPDATGSAAQNPSYAFEAAGTYDVTLVARRADAEGTVTKQVTVLEAAVAGFDVVTPEPWAAPVDIEFADTSTEDPLDPIVAWSWDFGGFGSSSAQNPGAVSFLQAGPVTVSLTVTTQSGFESTAELQLVID